MAKDIKQESKKTSKSKANSIAISVGSIIVFILIFISFIIVPGMVRSGTNELPVFGKYGKHAVKYEQGSYFNQCLAYYGNQIKNYGENYNEYIMEYLTRNAYQQAFNETIRRYAFMDFVEASGYTVSEKKVDRTMINQFTDQSGKYSEKLYRDTPESTKVAMRKSIEEEFIANRFLMDYFAKSLIQNSDGINFEVAVSQNEVNFINKMNKTTKSFDTVTFSTVDLPATEAQKFAQENPEMFTKYNFLAISAESESVAKKILSQIKKGEITFDEAVTKYSKNYYTTSDGVLKNKYEYQIASTLANENDLVKIADLQIDELSPVIKTGTGFTFFKCAGAKEAVKTNDSELTQVVTDYLKANEMGRIQDYYMTIANTFVENAKTNGFNSACQKFGKERVRTDNYVLNYSNNTLYGTAETNVDALLSAYNNEDFLSKLFALKDGEVSEPIVVENAIVVIRAINSNVQPNKVEFAEYKTGAAEQDYSTIIKGIYDSKKYKNNFDATYTKYFTAKK